LKLPEIDLVELIRSLSRGEKRYLLLQVPSEDVDYWQLYRAIEQTGSVAVADLEALNPTASYLKYLAVQKRYLQTWILDQLDRYRRKNVEESCWREIDHVRVWLWKGLFNKARKEIRRLERKAKRLELFDIQLQLCRLTKQLPAISGGKPISATQLESLFQKEQKVLNHLTNINQYWLVMNSLYEIQRRQDRAPDELERWGNHPLLRSLSRTTTLQSKIYFHQAKAIFAFTRGDTEEALSANAATLSLLDAHPDFIKLYPERYLSTLNNFLVDCLVAGRDLDLERGLQTLRALPERAGFKEVADLEVRVFRQSYLLEINQVLKDKQYHRAASILPGLLDGLRKYQDQIARHHRLTLTYLGSYLFFLDRNWEEALEVLQPMVRQEREDVVVEIMRYARLLFILLHFEMGNEELAESLLDSYRRSNKGKAASSETERWLLRYLRRCIRKGDRAITAIEKDQLVRWRSDFQESRFFQYIDLIHWLS
jgi:hypothetical protein